MPAEIVASTLARQLVAFTLAGLAGLAVDAGMFVLLTHAFLWPFALARRASVCGWVLTTWILIRAVSFAPHRSPRRGVEFARYAMVLASGLVVNIGVFGLCLWAAPALRQTPLVPLFFGCAAGFAFNFTVLRTLVFRRNHGDARRKPQESNPRARIEPR
jgi:putative flippase GtrA